MNTSRDMQITEHELLQMTADMDEMHHEVMPKLASALDDIAEGIRRDLTVLSSIVQKETSRRTFLKGGLVGSGMLAGGALLAACGGSSPHAATPTPTMNGSVDLTVARLASSLEVLAINTYGAALQAASSGALGNVPSSIGTFATTAMAQHKDHRDAWNAALVKAGQKAQTAPDPALNGMVQQKLKSVASVTDVANLALLLENVAAETYANGAGLLQSKANRLVSMSIAPVEAQHAAILSFVLGQYPIPNAFFPLNNARGPQDLNAA